MNVLQQLLAHTMLSARRFPAYDALPDGTDPHTAGLYVGAVLAHYGLTAEGWRFEADNALRRAGVCKPNDRVIGLSRYFLRVATPEQVRQTVLHEVAHALTPFQGHNAWWLRVARQLGYTGGRTCLDVPPPPGSWQAVCPGCGQTHHRYRKPKRLDGFHCRACGPHRGKLVWVNAGRP